MINFDMHCHLAAFPTCSGPTADAARQSMRGLELARAGAAAGAQAPAPGPAPTPSWRHRPKPGCAERFGVEQQTDWPAAPCRLLADGGEPGAALLAARRSGAPAGWSGEPADARRQRRCSTWRSRKPTALARQRSTRTFRADGLAFHRAAAGPLVSAPGASAARWQTTPLGRGRRAAASTRWLPRRQPMPRPGARCINEVQMLLHDASGQRAREARGAAADQQRLALGRRQLPRRRAAARSMRVWSRRPAAPRAWRRPRASQRARCPMAPARLLRAGAGSGVHLILLDRCAAQRGYGDAHALARSLLQLERDWFAPLLQALQQERIGMLSLHALGPAGTLSSEVTRGDLRRFWRRREAACRIRMTNDRQPPDPAARARHARAAGAASAAGAALRRARRVGQVRAGRRTQRLAAARAPAARRARRGAAGRCDRGRSSAC